MNSNLNVLWRSVPAVKDNMKRDRLLLKTITLYSGVAGLVSGTDASVIDCYSYGSPSSLLAVLYAVYNINLHN
eukprot:scaffold55608_cov22-Prasinocladus_malaysianus.AAC.1